MRGDVERKPSDPAFNYLVTTYNKVKNLPTPEVEKTLRDQAINFWEIPF